LHECIDQLVITPWLSCSLAFNRGVAWSFFHSESPFVFTVVTCLVLVVMGCVAWHGYERYCNSETIGGEVLVLAGACSNVIDRFSYGAVIDFIGFEYGAFCWPLFNFADVFIVMGIGIMMINMMKKEK